MKKIIFISLAVLLAQTQTQAFSSNFETLIPPQPEQKPPPNPKPPPPQPPPTPEPPPIVAMSPLLWEATKANTKNWSLITFRVIREEVPTLLLPGSQDVEFFCPRYHTLSNEQRINFWGHLISAMAKFESGFNPLARFKESSMGTDPVTQMPVYSEGLLQLSYQDIRGYRFCEFDWEKDKKLNPTDPRKTILDPEKNLTCGIRILARQIQRFGKIALKRGEGSPYWSVLLIDKTNSKVPAIASLTGKMPGCK